ncbi:calmodulin-binding transcription activator 3-like protein isoform X1 [Tanacetum coccineum]
MIGPSKPLNPNTNVPQKYGSKKDANHRNGSTGSHQKKGGVTSYVSVVNGVTPLVQPGNSLSSAPALVLDEECVVERDFSNCAMGRVKSFDSITKLQSLLVDEGFVNVTLVLWRLVGYVYLFLVKKAFKDHYEARFNKPTKARLKLSFSFPNRLSTDQVADLERHVSHDEISWLVGWESISHRSSLKILASRMAMVISRPLCLTLNPRLLLKTDLGWFPFILNEVLIGVKEEKKALFCKVDFAKLMTRPLDYLLDLLEALDRFDLVKLGIEEVLHRVAVGGEIYSSLAFDLRMGRVVLSIRLPFKFKELQLLLQEAPTRWFQSHEIKKILTNYEKFELRNSPPDRLVAGSTFLYDRVSNKSFRKDGHSWKKKKDGVTVNEKVEHLKIDGVAVIRYYVARREDNDKFQRRCYWFEDKLECVNTLDSVEVEKALPVEVEKLPVEANRRGKPLRVDKKKKQQQVSKKESAQQQAPKKESAPSGKGPVNIICGLCGSAVKSEAALDRHIEAHVLEIRMGVQLEHWDKEMFSLMKNQLVAAAALSHSGSPCDGLQLVGVNE